MVVGACGGSCTGDLHPVVADGAWQAEKCDTCNGRWWFQVPRDIGAIDAAVKVEARRRDALKGGLVNHEPETIEQIFTRHRRAARRLEWLAFAGIALTIAGVLWMLIGGAS